jgi:MerR family transcriptional regulator, repressor of the yfmOP operon
VAQLTDERTLRIGEVADRLDITTRTIRYYEERGLLRGGPERAKGSHRLYSEADVIRLQELIRLRDLLGLSLDGLVALAEAEEARAELRDRWADTTDDAERLRIVEAAIPLVERQLELVAERRQALAAFSRELTTKLRRLEARRAELR